MDSRSRYHLCMKYLIVSDSKVLIRFYSAFYSTNTISWWFITLDKIPSYDINIRHYVECKYKCFLRSVDSIASFIGYFWKTISQNGINKWRERWTFLHLSIPEFESFKKWSECHWNFSFYWYIWPWFLRIYPMSLPKNNFAHNSMRSSEVI